MVNPAMRDSVLPAWRWRRVGAGVLLVGMWLLGLQSLLWLHATAGDALWWDFGVYTRAAVEALAGSNPYEPFNIGRGFLNHPFVLTAVGFIAWLPSPGAGVLWMVASVAAWVGAIRVSNRLAMFAGGTTTLPVMALLLGFAPALETFYVGQINTFAVLAIVLSVWWSERGRPVAAGVALALAIVLKTSPVVLLGYFVGLRALRVVVTTLGVLVASSIVPALQFGPSIVLDFGATLVRLARDVHVSAYNQSAVSMVARLTAGGDTIALGHTLVVGGVFVLLVVAGLRTDIRQMDVRWRLWYVSLFIGVMVVAAPLVWYHHATLLLLPLTALLYTPYPIAVGAGLGAVLLFQGVRLWETMSGMPALPALIAQLVIVAMSTWLLYRATQRTAAASSDCAR